MTFVLHIVGALAPFESLQHLPVVRRQRRLSQEVRPLPPRQPQRLPPAPPRDARVVTRQQDRRHLRALELLGPRVLRRLQEPARERLPRGGFFTAERSRPKTSH